MIPTKMTVFQLFEKTRRYIVPLYQRQYAWTREGQWEPLWENICEKATAVLDSSQSIANSPSNHFLGAVVLNQVPTFGLQIDAAQIIDGQQRLTTLQLFLAALRDFAATASNEALLRGLAPLTKHSGVMQDETVEQFKVWPTNSDRADFVKVLSAASRAAVESAFPQPMQGRKKLPRPTMAEAYLYFYDSISEFIGGLDPHDGSPGYQADGIQALYNTLRKHLELVVIELEKDDDPQVIFETLNFGGVPLFPSDLVRNFVFLRANQQKEPADKLYNDLWLEFDTAPAESVDGDANLFWKRMEKQGRNKRTRLDLFLHHYLTYRKEEEVNIGHLFREFRNWWEGAPRLVSEELGRLRKHSDVFRSFFVPDPKTRLGQFAIRLRKLDTSTVYPVLLLLATERNHSLPESEFNSILCDLESYLIRRAVCGMSIKQYNRFFLSLLQTLRKGGPVTRQGVRDFLLAAQGSSNVWPNDKEFEKAWVREPAYKSLGPMVTAMILEAVDHQLRTSKCEDISIHGSLSVEHVLPQNWTEHWPVNGATPDPTTGDTPEDLRNRLLHSFGNLTLLTTPLNSSIQNGPFSAKRPEIAKQSSLRLNVYFQDFADSDTWNEEVIVKRGRDLFDVACTVWRYPV